MAGVLVVSGGRFFIHAGAPALPAATVTSGELRGAVTVQGSRPRRDLFNGVRAVYVDPAKNWQPTDAPPLLASNYVAEDGSEAIYRDLDFPLTTSPSTVQRLMKVELERNRRQRAVSVQLNLSAMRLRPWDGVLVDLDRLTPFPARVVGWRLAPEGGVDLTLGDGRGVEDSTFTLGRIVNNRIGLDIWCATATAWNTSNRYYGGHFACATGVNAGQDRFGVRLGNVREDIAGDVLASITTMQWNGPAKGWNAGAPMDDANLNRRQTLRVGASVAYAQVGVIGFDGPIDLQSLRLYGLPEAAPAVLNGTPLLTGALFGSGRREFAAEVSWDLPSLAPGATALLDVTVNGARAGDLATASLVSSTRLIEIDAAVWSNNTVRVMARNISGATFDLAAATLSVGVVKRRVP